MIRRRIQILRRMAFDKLVAPICTALFLLVAISLILAVAGLQRMLGYFAAPRPPQRARHEI